MADERRGPVPIPGQPRRLPAGARAKLRLPNNYELEGPAEVMLPFQATIEAVAALARPVVEANARLAEVLRRLERIEEQLAGRRPLP